MPSVFKGYIEEFIRASTGIKGLTIRQGCTAKYHSPNDLFTEQESVPSLDRLDIRGVSFPQIPASPSEATFLTAFKSLTHLNVGTPASDISLDNFWTALFHGGSQSLTSIKAPQVSPTFITFLRSFSGLHTLILESLEPRNETPMSELAHQSFTSGLTSHASILQRLSIAFQDSVNDIPRWTYTASQWIPCLSRLAAFKSLEILDGVSEVYGGALGTSFESLMIYWPEETFGYGAVDSGRSRWVRGFLAGEVVGNLRSKNGIPQRLVLYSGSYSAVEGPDGLWVISLLSINRLFGLYLC
ncbi:hypothetical protein AX16_004108 [Volvariella volvacea WC 439]|nr:hypothetical protein AX16_004108 [Volvariella volvacea WC 439]